MTYHCEDCGFLFYRTGFVSECPLCESKNFRIATEKEANQLQYHTNKEENTDEIQLRLKL